MSPQDLIIAGRRVWHDEAVLAGLVIYTKRRPKRGEGEKLHTHFVEIATGTNHLIRIFDVHKLQPILSAGEVRNQEVGAVLVDTLTREDCVVFHDVDGDVGVEYAEDVVHLGSRPYRDLSNRFALKSYGNEGETV